MPGCERIFSSEMPPVVPALNTTIMTTSAVAELKEDFRLRIERRPHSLGLSFTCMEVTWTVW